MPSLATSPSTELTLAAAAAAKLLQSCPTLCDPIDGSPPGSPVPGILQARTLEWVAISFSKKAFHMPPNNALFRSDLGWPQPAMAGAGLGFPARD